MSAIDRGARSLNCLGYDVIANSWDSSRGDLATLEKEIIDRALLHGNTGDYFIDLGCGTGRPICELALERGFEVVGVDQSSSMLMIARNRMPTASWIQCPLEDFESRDKASVIVAWDSLFHVPRSLHAKIFRQVRLALCEGGKFAFTSGGVVHLPFIQSVLGHPFYFDSHPPETVLELLVQVGFRLEMFKYLENPTKGANKGRCGFLAIAV